MNGINIDIGKTQYCITLHKIYTDDNGKRQVALIDVYKAVSRDFWSKKRVHWERQIDLDVKRKKEIEKELLKKISNYGKN
jgi:hypothetical protein